MTRLFARRDSQGDAAATDGLRFEHDMLEAVRYLVSRSAYAGSVSDPGDHRHPADALLQPGSSAGVSGHEGPAVRGFIGHILWNLHRWTGARHGSPEGILQPDVQPDALPFTSTSRKLAAPESLVSCWNR